MCSWRISMWNNQLQFVLRLLCVCACIYEIQVYVVLGHPLYRYLIPSWKTQTNGFPEKLSINHHHHHRFESLYFDSILSSSKPNHEQVNAAYCRLLCDMRPIHVVLYIQSNKIGCSSLVYRIKCVNQQRCIDV